MATEISFAAALRDVHSPNKRARNIAVRNLAQGLLDELGRPSPNWKAAHAHARGDEVLVALRNALDIEDDPSAQGLALVGLAQLGEPELLDVAQAWLDYRRESEPGEAEADARTTALREGGAAFLRECAVIALGLLARATPNMGPEAELGTSIYARCLSSLTRALTSSHDDVRFQAAMSLAELGDEDCEAQLVEALRQEQVVEVMRNQVAALNTFEEPSQAAIEVRAQLLEGEHADSEAAFRAAVGLAALRDARAGEPLLRALAVPARRDRALEALAALGETAPAQAAEQARRIAQAWLTPKVTRVRAAYALARMTPTEGRAMLNRMAKSVRPAVRAAVRDAAQALAQLAADDAGAAQSTQNGE